MTDTTSSLHRRADTVDLLRSARGGDEGAWRELFERYRRYLRFRVEMRLPAVVRRQLPAEDVLQSAFLACWRNIDSFEYRGEGSFLRWLTSIVMNAARNQVRRVQAERRHLQVESGAFESTSLEPPDQRVSTPHEYAAEAEFVMRARDAFSRMTEDEQQVIGLRMGGATWEEIGKVLELSPNGARGRFLQALARLQKLAGGSHDEEHDEAPPD